MSSEQTHEPQAYQPETAAELYADVREACALVSDHEAQYVRLRRLFLHVLDECATFAHVTLVGPFAKTDYLLKEHHAPKRLSAMVGELRVRLHRFGQGGVEEKELRECWRDDVQALCLFIEHLYQSEVPATLRLLFPERRRRRKAQPLVGECVRLIVARWDEAYIYGPLEHEAGEVRQVRYAPLAEEEAKAIGGVGADWSYLRPLLAVGTQLHLIRPRLLEGVLLPELIILEPDYLVDISQVARSMEEYGSSPLVYLIHQLEPVASSEAILLGNLAGQLLDEELHHGADETYSYADVATTFFHRNALALLEAGVSTSFHQQALAQQGHIRQAIRHVLPQRVGSFDSRKVMVEPSFISPMLGLQGRMDFLQLDHRLVIEQKSGRGAFVPGDADPSTPKVQQPHYVQLLLYMALLRYNFRERYEANGHELHAFLLYSKYDNALLGLGFAPQLLLDALRLRNQLVWHQYRLAQGGYDVLGRLTPEQLNTRHEGGTLWQRYKRPQIEALLRPIHEASATERAYYYRMLSFVMREHQLSKLGNQTKESSGFSSVWLDALDDKLAAGNIYHGLTLASPQAGAEGRVEEVTLHFPQQATSEASNFREGDIVMLYSYQPDATPLATHSMVFRCTIASITPRLLHLRLKNAQTDAHVFARHADRHWAVEHDFYESADSAHIRGLHAFLSAPQARRDLLMLQRHPRVDEGRTLVGHYGALDELALRVRQAVELFLIIGPPGTGKTSFGMFNTLLEELRQPEANVLVMAYTNRAVDEICSKLLGVVDFIRLGSALSCAPPYRAQMLDERVKACRHIDDLRLLLQRTRVFVGTTTALNNTPALFAEKRFSLAIVDEASQILEPQLVGLFSACHRGEAAITKFVLIGDHKQLPAVVGQTPQESRTDDPLLHAIGLHDCRLSLFERLLQRYGSDPSVTYMLTRQGRMHPDIAAFPNEMFYGGVLTPVPLPHQAEPSATCRVGDDDVSRRLASQRVLFFACCPPAPGLSDKVNQPEADLIASLVERVYRREEASFEPAHTLGVIVPYRNQIATVRSAIARLGLPALEGITIDTVERYQGSQRRVIIYGFTVQRHYQLRFLTSNTFVEDGRLIDRKLNVAMTRAQEQLIMVGNPALLSLNPLFGELVRRYGV